MAPPTMRRPVHVEFDYNDLHVSGDLLKGRDHIYKVDAVIDSGGRRHRLSTNESKAILRKIDSLCEITRLNKPEVMHMANRHSVRGHLPSKVERPD